MVNINDDETVIAITNFTYSVNKENSLRFIRLENHFWNYGYKMIISYELPEVLDDRKFELTQIID